VEDVDEVPEAAKVDAHEVVDGQAGDVLEGLHRELDAAVGVGGVQLVVAHAGDVPAQVAWQ
jgi:hypothetical protein